MTEQEPRKLADTYIVPPFNVLDGKQKAWLERKRLWNGQIQDKAEGRPDAKAYNNKSTNDKARYTGNGVMKNEVSIFDPVLAEVLLSWFTDDDKKAIIDPFAGDTVIGYVAGALGKTFTGIELRQEQVDFNKARTEKFRAVNYICDDAVNILNHVTPNSQDFLISCPPYFNLETYSDLPNDASNQASYSDFLKIIDTAFTNAIKTMKPNRFAAVIVGDIRDTKTGYYYGFPEDIISIFKANDMGLYNRMILLTPFGTAQLRAERNMRLKKPVNVYQQVLVFFNGNPKTIKAEFAPVYKNDYIEAKNESTDVQ